MEAGQPVKHCNNPGTAWREPGPGGGSAGGETLGLRICSEDRLIVFADGLGMDSRG